MAHIGLPWQVDALHVAAKHPHVYVDISARDAPAYGGGFAALFRELSLARTLMMLDKVLYGSDFPLAHPPTFLNQIRNINDYAEAVGEEPLTTEEINMILGGNTERMFRELSIL